MTNINTACVKNNASYQFNNELPNKETISSNFCERLEQWGNKSLNNGEERAIAVERIKEAYNSNMASLDLSYLDLSELPPIPSTVNTLNLENNCLTCLDFTDNASLVNINLSFNKINTITFPNESNLESLDLKNQHSLVNLEAQNNNLKKINISDSYKLKFLNLDYNKLASLDVSRQESLIELSAHHNMITDLILHNHPRMKTITLNDNHIAHLNTKTTTKLEYLNLSNNNLLPINDIDQLISSKHLWHLLVNGINNDPLAQMQYWTAVRNIIDDTNEVTIDLSYNLAITNIDTSDEHLVEVSDNSEGNYIKDNDSMSIRYRSKYYSREYTLIEEETIFSDAELKAILPMRRMYGVGDYKSNSSSLSSHSGLKDPTGTPVCYYIHNESKPSLGYGPTCNNWLSQSFTTEL
ncbi:leucine-rich repeat domain-containing protein [Escherichia coli]|nr:leucine-rich repeat domain-containing protein [Escherichia coli]